MAGAILLALGAGSSRPGLIAYTFSAFVLGTILVELVRGTMATGSLFTLVSRNRRRYGGYIVHAAVVLFAIGIAGSSAYGSSTERRLTPGQSVKIEGYTLTLRDVRVTQTPNATETRAFLDVRGRWNGTISSGDNQYRNPLSRRARSASAPTGCAPKTSMSSRTTSTLPRRRVRQGPREAARQPALGRRGRFPHRLGGRVVAGCT